MTINKGNFSLLDSRVNSPLLSQCNFSGTSSVDGDDDVDGVGDDDVDDDVDGFFFLPSQLGEADLLQGQR